jgi:hypothetical protein
MPLSSEVLRARIDLRVCELRVLAAETFVEIERNKRRAKVPAPGALSIGRRLAAPPLGRSAGQRGLV